MRLQLRLFDQFHRALTNVDGDIADALQILHDFQSSRDKSQIAGDGLLESQEFIAQVIDFEFELIYFIVGGDDGFSQ
jgi:hypothetical protein